MQIHFVTFTGLAPGAEKLSKEYGQKDQIRDRQKKLSDSAIKFGRVNHVHLYNREQLIKTSYYENNKSLLDEPVGCGYWAWKPYIILDALSKSKANDYVIYCDVGKPIEKSKNDHGNLITTSLEPLIEWAERHDGMLPGVYLSNHGPAKKWIKRDCFILMGCDEPEYHNTPTVQAGYTVWKNTPKVINFLKKWQTLNLDSRLISNQENTLGKPNYEGFVRSCHDQSTLTLLTKKEGVSVFGGEQGQFLGFRNINFIAHEASFQNAASLNQLILNKVNSKELILAPYIVRWVELLFQYRRFENLSILIVQDEINEQLKYSWKKYFPNAEINIFEISDLINSKKEYDLILNLDSKVENIKDSVLLKAFISLKNNGAFFFAPLAKESEFEQLARFISNEGHFPEAAVKNTLYRLPIPKIPNSRNPIFVTGKGKNKELETMCLMIKPVETVIKMNANQKTKIEKNRPKGLPPLPAVWQISLLVDDKNYSQVDLYAQLILRALPNDPYANLAAAWVADYFSLQDYKEQYFENAKKSAKLENVSIEEIAFDLHIELLDFNESTNKAIDNETVEAKYHLAKAWGFGFGAEMSSLMGQAYLAEVSGRELIVHWGSNFLYRPEEGSECVFDCYFEKFNDLSINDIEGSLDNVYPPKWTKKTIYEENLNKRKGPYSKLSSLYFFNRSEKITVSDYYAGVVNIKPWVKQTSSLYDLSFDDTYRYLAKKYLVPQKYIVDEVDDFINKNIPKEFIAVHARGSDKDEGYRALTSIPNQTLQCAKEQLSKMADDAKLFLMTDDTALLNIYQEEFGDRLVQTECQRCETQVGVHYDDATNKLQAGKEMLIDMLIAARASFFIGLGLSNPSQLITYFGDFNQDNYILFGENRLKQFNTHLYKTISVK